MAQSKKKQVRLTPNMAKRLGITPRAKSKKHHGNPQYKLNKEQYALYQEFMEMIPNQRKFVETQKKFDKNGNVTSTIEKFQSEPIDIPPDFEIIKVSTSKTTGQQWVQYAKKQVEDSVLEIDFEKIIKKYIKPIEIIPEYRKTIFTFDRLVYTDVHVGMTPNENGFSLYGGKWDEDEINSRLETLIAHVLEHKKSNVLIIDELGDFLDGFDGETVRKGHKLPQNMDNEQAHDVAVGFKIKLVDSLAKYYTKIICNNICNDNHAGSFGYFVNSAFKLFIEERYSHVQVTNFRKFIDHYFYGKNCFIITHGKDGKNLKFGFKPILDAKQIEKIDNYIKEHKLHDYIIEFSKGDSHQKIFDESTSDTFDYYNYGAFSPSSEWVQTNFKKGKSFFEFFNFKENGQKIHNPYRFTWNSEGDTEKRDYATE